MNIRRRTSITVVVLLACVLLAQGAQDPAPAPAPPFTITKERLKERITELEAAREQAIANVNALTGAIQESQHWLAQLEAAENKETKEKKE